MIYLDNAATGWPKHPAVIRAMGEAMVRYGANPGRSGHRMGMETAEQVYRCRRLAADTFGLPDPSRVVFTPNCTGALNLALRSLTRRGRVIASDMEHNSVMRPLALSGRYDLARVGETEEETVANFRRLIRRDTVAIACTHASNAFGNLLPIRRLGALCREQGLLFLVDAAQTAGILPIDMREMQIDLLCMPGHKGLGGPAGTGMLLCGDRFTPDPLTVGGSGTASLSLEQPEELPERLESGTLNTVGICGLAAALALAGEGHAPAAYRQEMAGLAAFYDGLRGVPGVRLYTPRPRAGAFAPVLSFNLAGKTPEQTAALLDDNGVAVRAGLHCAPAAHRHMGTLPEGTVRVSPSPRTTRAEWAKVLQIIYKIQ